MVSRVYNRVARRYDDDWAGIYARARARNLQQILDQLPSAQTRVDTVDFGIGTGNALHELGQFVSLGHCTGFDVSTGMLDQAANKLRGQVKLINDDVSASRKYLGAESVDLALCHFLLSFVDSGLVLEETLRVLRPGGLLSLATSTRHSLKELHSGRFRHTGRLFGVERHLSQSSTPADHDSCLQTLRDHGFEIAAEELLRQPVCFQSFDDVRDWALHSGWVASALEDHTSLRIAGASGLFALARIFMHPLYPIHAVNEASIVLARKPFEPVESSAAMIGEMVGADRQQETTEIGLPANSS